MIYRRCGFSFLIEISRPKSRGVIELASKDPFEHPIIHAGYFTHPYDINVLIEGVKFCNKIMETKAFKKLGAKLWSGRKFPGCEKHKMWSDKYIECIVRQLTQTVWHFSGTAKMGPKSDETAVVDPRLRVYGIKGLRVIDASVMPTITSGNINAPVIMIGEKV